MKLLLDTQSFIWFSEDNASLSQTAKASIENIENDVYLSTVSLWEITIKMQLKKLTLNKTLSDIFKYIPEHSFEYLDIKPSHLLKLSILDFIHKDPFDRMLVTQAMAEDMVLVTKDENIWQYSSVKLLW